MSVQRDSFEKFYFEKVALGEGCGCAEHVTRTRELDALSARLASGRASPEESRRPLLWARRLVRRLFAKPAANA
jgi:hypothetical protein